MAVAITKNELKKDLKEKLQCDQGFINHITGSRLLQNLQDAYSEQYGQSEINDAMNEIFEEYKSYCSAWNLDVEADNRKNKEYLGRIPQKRIVIPPVTDEMREQFRKSKKK